MTAKKDKVLRPINPNGGAHHFDLLAQIEDELILSVPYVPSMMYARARANDGDASQEPVVKRPSPFAVLEQLKHKIEINIGPHRVQCAPFLGVIMAVQQNKEVPVQARYAPFA